MRWGANPFCSLEMSSPVSCPGHDCADRFSSPMPVFQLEVMAPVAVTRG